MSARWRVRLRGERARRPKRRSPSTGIPARNRRRGTRRRDRASGDQAAGGEKRGPCCRRAVGWSSAASVGSIASADLPETTSGRKHWLACPSSYSRALHNSQRRAFLIVRESRSDSHQIGAYNRLQNGLSGQTPTDGPPRLRLPGPHYRIAIAP